MSKTLKRFCALLLCVVTLCSICAIPVGAIDDSNGTYMIHSITLETGTDTAYVQITSQSGSVLCVALYDSESGQMLGIGSTEVTEPVVRQEVSLTLTIIQ